MKTRGRVALVEAGSPGLNIYSHVAMGRGVTLLATAVRDAGYEVQAFIEDVSGKDSIDWEYVSGADVVGFSSITCTLPRSGHLEKKVRAINPRAIIVFGGPEPTCAPERSFEIGADFVLRGEGELTFPYLLDVLLGHAPGPLGNVPGLVWRDAEGMREDVPPRQLTCTELDGLPVVDRSLVHGAVRADVASVWRARGCPQRCDFCEVCEIWPRYSARKDEHSLEELERAQEDGYPTAFLIDDNAAADKPAFKEFLRAAAERGYAKMLVTQIRADSVFRKDGRVDREFLRLLKRAASATIVCIGVESAADEDLERIHKRTDARRTTRALRAMKRRGLLVHGMFIAFKEDTKGVIRRNGEYARKYVTSLQYLFETPLPGTKRTAEHRALGAMLFEKLEDLSLYDGMHVVLRPVAMAAADMQAQVLREYRRFYSRRRIVSAALSGTFVRYRRLSAAQRAYLRAMAPRLRLRQWARFHVEYKYAPVAFLVIGYRRVRQFLRDPEYLSYVSRLSGM